MWRTSVLTFLALIIISFNAPVSGEDKLGQDESCENLSKLRMLYKKHAYISLNFAQYTYSEIFETVDSICGTLKADQTGKYRLSLYDSDGLFQELVNDGFSHWSYSVENRQAILSEVANLDSWNPVTLLYDPEAVYQCDEEQVAGVNDKNIAFSMIASDSSSIPQSFSLEVTGSDFRPLRIIYFDDNNSRIEIWISEFSRLNDLPDSLFYFSAPDQVEIIKMP